MMRKERLHCLKLMKKILKKIAISLSNQRRVKRDKWLLIFFFFLTLIMYIKEGNKHYHRSDSKEQRLFITKTRNGYSVCYSQLFICNILFNCINIQFTDYVLLK